MVSWLGVGQVLQRFLRFSHSNHGRQARLDEAGHVANLPSITRRRNGTRTLQIVYPAYESLYDGES